MRYYILQVQREPFTRQGGGLALCNAQRAVERGFHGRLAAAAQRVLGTAGGVRLAYYNRSAGDRCQGAPHIQTGVWRTPEAAMGSEWDRELESGTPRYRP